MITAKTANHRRRSDRAIGGNSKYAGTSPQYIDTPTRTLAPAQQIATLSQTMENQGKGKEGRQNKPASCVVKQSGNRTAPATPASSRMYAHAQSIAYFVKQISLWLKHTKEVRGMTAHALQGSRHEGMRSTY
jgi:hypothetical protein